MNQQKEKFTELFNEHAPGIRKLCLGYTGDGALAEDLLQETFIAVWHNMEKFRGDAKWSTWIFRIAVNTCLSHLRKKKEPLVNMDEWPLASIADETNQKEQEVQLLYKCISQLAEADRLIITMVLEDKSYTEIAAITDISENNLRVKIHRIKKQLTEIYNRYERF